MAIIYSYPEKLSPAGGDFLVITDSEQPAPNKNRTKSLTIDNLASYVISSQSAITGSGTPGFVPIFTTATTLGDSAISQPAIAKGVNDVYITEDVIMSNQELAVDSIRLSGALYAPTQFQPFWSSGTAGQLLSSTGTGVEWTSGGPVVGSGTPDTLTAWNAAGTGIKNSIVSQTVTQNVTPIGILNINGRMQQSETRESIYIGKNVGSSINTFSAFQMLNNIGIGDEVLKNFETGIDGGGALEVPGDNVGIGYKALETTTVGTNNIGIGTSALNLVDLGGNNIAIGKNSLAQLGYTTGAPLLRTITLGNTAMGFNALTSMQQGTFNIAIGQSSLEAALNTQSTIAIGRNVAKAFTGNMDRAIMIGDEVLDEAGTTSVLTSVANSIFIGKRAGALHKNIASGDIGIGNQVFLGVNNGFNSGGENIAIGAGAQGNNATGSNTRSIKIGSDSGVAYSYATNVSAVDTSSFSPNQALGNHSALIGGYGNTVQAQAGFIGAGHSNTIGADAIGAAILGGFDNTISPSSAQGTAGMALGSNLNVEGNNQVVVGRYNVSNDNSKFIVGAGFSNANRKNAFEVMNTSQIRLAQYPSNFTPTTALMENIDLLVLQPNGFVYRMPSVPFQNGASYLPTASTPQGASAGGQSNEGPNIARFTKVTWTGVDGTYGIRLPNAADTGPPTLTHRIVEYLTDETFSSQCFIEFTVAGGGADINGANSKTISGPYKSIKFWSDGNVWYILNEQT